MTASLPPRDGRVPSPRAIQGDADARPADRGASLDGETLGAPARGDRLLALTAPGPLHVRWVPVVIGSLVIAGVLTLILGGAPTYDPWAWIIWGREIIHGDLVTTSGPSWKPLPMLFTIPFALLGGAAPDLWMWVARALALVGIVAVADLAARLGGRLAAGLAALATAVMPLYYAYGVQGSSEGMLVLVCVLAATSWLDGHRTHAFWWLVLAALLRPEAWAFVAVSGLERVKDRPARIPWIGVTGAVVLAAWLVPEKLGSGAFLRAATRAHDPNPESAAFAKSPTLEVLGSMANLMLWLPLIGAIIALALGVWTWRSRGASSLSAASVRRAGFLTLLALGWVAIVAAMTEGGYAGNPRYLAAPLALMIAVGLAGVAWLVAVLARRGAASVGEFAVLAAIVTMIVVATLRLPARTEEITWQSANRDQLGMLADRPGFRDALLRCGPLVSHPLMVPPIAWTMRLHIEDVISDEPAPSSGTYVVGTNAASRPLRPIVPAGTVPRELARTSQFAVLQRCPVR